MSELYEKSLLKLELDKVLEMLSACAGSLEGKAACLRVRPLSDLEDVQALLEETTAASERDVKTYDKNLCLTFLRICASTVFINGRKSTMPSVAEKDSINDQSTTE